MDRERGKNMTERERERDGERGRRGGQNLRTLPRAPFTALRSLSGNASCSHLSSLKGQEVGESATTFPGPHTLPHLLISGK